MDIEKYLDKLDQDRRDTEARIHQERIEVEVRMDTRYNQLIQDRRESEARMDARSEKMDVRFDKAMDELTAVRREVSDKLDTTVKEIKSESTASRRWMIGLCVSATMSVIALAITAIINIVNLAKP